MGIIRQLDYETAMLVAAGEVIERPASIVKELLENAIDSGANKITLEIQKGGIALIRCTDNGCGIAKEDLPLAIMRNATSKIRTSEDIAKILTLGFRGEALASVAAVSDLRIRSKRPSDAVGAQLEVHPGDEKPTITEFPMTDGTTVISENLFMNVPARRKFLKRDSAEAAHITELFERIALSNPSIAMNLIIDGKEKYQTTGDGNLQHTIYSIYGGQFASKLISLDYGENLKLFGGGSVDIKVTGFIGTPDNSRGTRQSQIFYINGRNVRSRCLQSALEQGFVSYMEASRFPTCVMFVTMPPEFVDVNIHPTKLEVKFVADKPVFEAVFYAVRGALERYIPRPELELEGKNVKEATYELYKQLNAFVPIEERSDNPRPVYNNQKNIKQGQLSFVDQPTVAGVRKDDEPSSPINATTPHHAPLSEAESVSGEIPSDNPASILSFVMNHKDIPGGDEKCQQEVYLEAIPPELDAIMTAGRRKPVEPQRMYLDDIPDSVDQSPTDTIRPEGISPMEQQRNMAFSGHSEVKKSVPFYKIIGEAFLSYVFVEVGDKIMIIDKHAAHERIIFEELKENMRKSRLKTGVPIQMLIAPVEIALTPPLLNAVTEYSGDIRAVGFGFEIIDQRTVSVNSIPAELGINEAKAVFETIADGLSKGTGSPLITRDTVFEKALYQASCKAAIKIGREYDTEHLKWICDRLLVLDDIKVCPHGRPVAFELSKNSIEYQFKRL